MNFIKISSLVATCLFCASCMNATNDKLDTMNGNMNRMATQVEADQTQIQSLNDNAGRIAKETEVYEDSIKTLAEQLKVVAETMTDFKNMGVDVENTLKETFKPAPPAQTHDLDDELKDQGTAAPAVSKQPMPNPAVGGTTSVVAVKGVGGGVVVSNPSPSSPAANDPQNGATRLSDSFCVSTTLDRVLGDVTNYDGLQNIPGAKYEISGIGNLLQMVKSQSRFSTKTPKQTDAVVWLVLQPTNLADGSLYPRFLLHCTSQSPDQNSFDHRCQMYQDKEHFGLTNFVSHIHGDVNGCGNGQVKVDYDLTMTANDADVDAIKTAALARLGVLAPLAGHLFNEQLFFKAYFRNLFTNWIHDVH